MTQRSAALLLPVLATIVVTPAVAFGAGIDGPALIAWQPNYNMGLPGLGVHGPGCHNQPARMPAGRQEDCGQPTLTKLGTGRFQIDAPNAAPFPEGTVDTGWLSVITSVEGGASQCFEESTTVMGADLQTVVRCVDETGADVEVPIAWSYRADSLQYPQLGAYVPNFAYARVERDGSLNDAESFNPLSIHEEDILAVKGSGAGSYTVTFKDLNPLDAKLEPTRSPYNVIVQKTCAGDTAGGADADGCFRTVCAPVSWTPGDFETRDTTVEVRCTGADGEPRDTAFRVYFGDGGLNSQGSWEGNYHFAWADWLAPPSAPDCYELPDIMADSQHELPISFPGLPVQLCREALGVYQVNFLEPTFTPYTVDGASPIVSSRATDGTHCNVQQVRCRADFNACGIPGTTPTARVTIGCFDPSGAPADAQWNMAMTY